MIAARTLKPPRIPTSLELERMARTMAARSAGDPSIAEALQWLDAARVAVFDDYMPDGPGYAGPVAVVVWSGGVDLHSVFTLPADELGEEITDLFGVRQ